MQIAGSSLCLDMGLSRRLSQPMQPSSSHAPGKRREKREEGKKPGNAIVGEAYHWGQKDYLLDLTPDELFWVIPCVSCVRKRTSRETNRRLKITSASAERQKRSQNLAPVQAINYNNF